MFVCCKVEGSAEERSEDVESFLTSQGLITDSQEVNKAKDLTEATGIRVQVSATHLTSGLSKSQGLNLRTISVI